jgi:hypothetical protein
MNKVFKPLLALSLIWNIALVAGVVFNQNYAHTRAAGGQFSTFPVSIRIAYLLTLAILFYQFLIFFSNIKRPEWIYKTFFFLGLLSIFVNAISRSANERWNVIPALVIAYAFYKKWKK